MKRWNSRNPARASACGELQAAIVAGIDVEVTPVAKHVFSTMTAYVVLL